MNTISLKNYLRESLSLILLFTFIIISMFIYFNFQKDNHLDSYLESLRKQYETQYRIVNENFDKLSQNTFYGIINKPEVYNLVKYAYKKDDEMQNFYRKLLYDRLIADYSRLKEFKFKQIQFHFPDNTSFLRMHKPEFFGDTLKDVRYSVSKVNETLKPLNGYEIGRLTDGFRFIYPLFDEELFPIGSVEVSVGSDFFERNFENNYNVDLHFLMKKEIAKNSLIVERYNSYSTSPENINYIFTEDKKETKHYSGLNFYTNADKKNIELEMNNSKSFILFKKYDHKYFAICFLPISDIEGNKNAAYMVIYQDSKFIEQIYYNFYKMVLILILLVLFFIFYLKYRYKQIQEKKHEEYILSQQSKMVALGEIIENIAHQWRQPLSVISILASGIKLKKQCNMLEEKELYDNLDAIVKNTEHLSNTIEDFRSYFNESLERKSFNLKNAIEQCIGIFKEDLTAKNIIVIENIDEIEIFSYETELKQVLINILKNCRDFIKEGVIIIKVHEKDSKIKIEIQDSAGGIAKKDIKRVFEPYYTSKHKSVGIGLGLFNSYEIVTKKLNGEIYVENKEFNYNFKTYTGACFSIVLYRNRLEE